MDDLTVFLIQAGSMVSTVTFMFRSGLETHVSGLSYLRARRGLLFKSFLSIDVIVPLITVAVIILASPSRATAVGLLVLAAPPVAPMVLKKILDVDGNQEYAVGLHFMLAWLVIITTPITIEVFSRMLGFQIEVSPFTVAGLVGISILLPISTGMIIGRLYPVFGGKIIKPLVTISETVSVWSTS